MADSDATVLRQKKTRIHDDSPDEIAHIVMRDDQMRGYATGAAITALCGKVWIPTRDYEGLAVCPKCSAERDRIVAGMKRLN